MAGYFLACLNHLAEKESVEVLVYMKKINQIAPFQFNHSEKIVILERENFSFEQMKKRIQDFNPDFTYVSGWLYKPYHKIIRQLKLPKAIIGFDNQYNGSIRQLLGSQFFRLYRKAYIEYAFVPGSSQKRFAKLLGFAENKISENLYCCDYGLFNGYYRNTITEKKKKFPKRILFVGRYVNEKGVKELWQAFIELKKENINDWELWCVGKGPIDAVKHPSIKHLGFIQPDKQEEIIKETGVFILPSKFEPWGVVLHEFATAGFPIIATEQVGSSEKFIADNQNGFLIASNDKDSVKNALKKIISLNNTELLQMSDKSAELASKLTPDIWAKCLLQMVYGRNM